jgi:hypothetical protein
VQILWLCSFNKEEQCTALGTEQSSTFRRDL